MNSPSVFSLSGRTALVTGGSSGLGAHFASVLAEAGAHVVLAARRADELNKVGEAIRSAGGRCSCAVLDVTEPGSLQTIAPWLRQIDILVNNAGVVRERAALELSDAEWDAVLDTNLKAMFRLAQTVARAMRDRGQGGSIINIASILGLRQSSGLLPYAVSKAGVIQLTKVLALELARHKIRVNALAPGYIATDLNTSFWAGDAGRALIKRIPQRRLGEKRDLNGALLLLASDASAYMTGSVICVDGGHLVSSL